MRCRNCGKRNSRKAIFCAYCGVRLTSGNNGSRRKPALLIAAVISDMPEDSVPEAAQIEAVPITEVI